MCDRREGVIYNERFNTYLTRIPCPARLILVSAVETCSEPGRCSEYNARNAPRNSRIIRDLICFTTLKNKHLPQIYACHIDCRSYIPHKTGSSWPTISSFVCDLDKSKTFVGTRVLDLVEKNTFTIGFNKDFWL